MDRIVERLVRQLVAAQRTGDIATHILLWARLEALGKRPDAQRSFRRAMAIVDTRVPVA